MNIPTNADTAPAPDPADVPSHAVPDEARAGEGDGTAEGGAHDAGTALPTEIGGQAGPEPTRYGDWEKKGRCTDF